MAGPFLLPQMNSKQMFADNAKQARLAHRRLSAVFICVYLRKEKKKGK